MRVMMKRPHGYAVAVLLAAVLAGCGTSRLPRGMVRYPPGLRRLNPNSAPDKVKDAISLGDRWREATYNALFQKKNWGLAWWYAEEAKKCYTHVLENLEPHNAYAALNLGYLSLILARDAPPEERNVSVNLAHAKLELAKENRKGYALAYLYTGELYAVDGQWMKAAEAFSELVDSGIEDAYVHAWWGYALMQAGMKAEANEHLRLAVEEGDPEPAATWARRMLGN